MVSTTIVHTAQISKQKAYNKRMRERGFVSSCMWVHEDDLGQVRAYAAALRDSRKRDEKKPSY